MPEDYGHRSTVRHGPVRSGSVRSGLGLSSTARARTEPEPEPVSQPVYRLVCLGPIKTRLTNLQFSSRISQYFCFAKLWTDSGTTLPLPSMSVIFA